jgi:hypothetical protein
VTQVAAPIAVRTGFGWTTALTIAATTTVAFANGGYFASTWCWIALIAAWTIVLAMVFRRFEGPRLVLVPPCALAALVGASLLELDRTNASAIAYEAERSTMYVLALGAFAFVARAAMGSLAGVAMCIATVDAYALATRLAPGALGRVDAVAPYRLAEPLGYWNGLGILSVLGALCAIGAVANGSARLRALAASTLPVVAATIYFTFSRGAWIALVIGFCTALAFATARLRILVAIAVAGPWAAAAVFIASRQDSLTHVGSSFTDAAREGNRLAAGVFALALCSGIAGALFAVADQRLAVPASLRRGAACLAVLVAIGVGAFAVHHFGAPWTIGANAYQAFKAPPPRLEGDLNARLFSFSGNGRPQIWETTWNQFKTDPVRGSGAGSFEPYWLEHREIPLKVRDAHSLYLETLAERGVLGLALLLVALLAPLYAAIRARRHPLVACAAGAYVAFLVHAGVDWDWEMPVVTLIALFIGATIIMAIRKPGGKSAPPSRRVRAGALAAVLAIMVAAFVGLVGNMALSQSARAARAGNWTGSIDQARQAKSWAPWSPEPHRRIGDAELALGRSSRARASYRQAIDKAPRDWSLWFDLARASTGAERRRALARAAELNPLSPEIAQFRKELR